MTTLIKEQFVKFSLGRKSTSALPNEFVATFIDSTKDYTIRTVNVKNSASIKQEGTTRQKSFDFTAFQSTDIVFKQLYKALKKYSFPQAALSFDVSRTIGNTIQLSELITIQNNDFGIDAEFRITTKIDNEKDDNTISFEAEQYTVNLYDSNYVDSGASSWTPPAITLVPLIHSRVIELPYNNTYKFSSAYLILVQREIGIETGFQVYISTDGVDYSYLKTLDSYSQYGTLSNPYAITNDLDNGINGITYTPYKEDLTWNSISRQNLFLITRYAIIDNEVIAFQDYTPSGISDINLTKLIRGVQYSDVASHLNGVDIWIANATSSNNIQIDRGATFYLKLVPVSGGSVGDLAAATAITVTPSFTAKHPYMPARIEATRSGSTVSVKIYPVLKSNDGAGKLAENAYSDVSPFSFDGILQYQIDTGSWVSIGNTYEFSITNSAAFTLNAEQILYSFESSVISVSVGTADGLYIGR